MSSAEHTMGGRTRAHALDLRTRAGPRRASAGYTHAVRAMKLLLPLIAVGLVALILAWPHLSGNDVRSRIGIVGGDGADAVADPSMINARFIGQGQNRDSFMLTADAARPADEEGSLILLDNPKADMTMDDGTWLALTADKGEFLKAEEQLELIGGVNLFHDDGYEFRTATALVDLKNGAAMSNDIVVGHGPAGVLHSQGFLILDRGERIIFTGLAKMTIRTTPPEPVQ